MVCTEADNSTKVRIKQCSTRWFEPMGQCMNSTRRKSRPTIRHKSYCQSSTFTRSVAPCPQLLGMNCSLTALLMQRQWNSMYMDKTIIAEATITCLINQSSGELTDMGWFKFFQFERLVASVGVAEICQAFLFSMDRAHVDVFRMFSKSLLRSFPCLHELWQTGRLNHLTWTEQHVLRKTRPPAQQSI